MNNIKFNCTECGSSVEVPQEYAGQQGTCPFCNKTITVPSAPKVSLKLTPPAITRPVAQQVAPAPAMAPAPQMPPRPVAQQAAPVPAMAPAPQMPPRPVAQQATPAAAPQPVMPKATPAAAPQPVMPKATPAAAPQPVMQKAAPQVPPTPAAPQIAVPQPNVPEEAMEEPPKPKKKRIEIKLTKKQKIIGGSITLGILLLLSGYSVFNWYTTTYIPKKEQAELHELFTKADKLEPQKKLALLKDFAAKTSSKNMKSVVTEHIQATEEKIAIEAKRLAEQKRQEEQRLAEEQKREAARKAKEARKKQLEEQRLAEKRKREELKRQQEEKAREFQESVEKDYAEALNTDRDKHIFIIRKADKKSLTKFFLFKHDVNFENSIRNLQQYKSDKIAYNEIVKQLIDSYEQKKSSDTLAELQSIKAKADEAIKKIPELAAQLAELGKNLLIEGNSQFHKGNFAFRNVLNEKWLILGLSDKGHIIYTNVQKIGDFPIFLEFSDKGFRDVTQDYCSDEKRELAKKRYDANQKVIKQVDESERLFENEYKKRLAKEKKPLFEFQDLPDFEKEISGLVFFAKLQTNLNATGGTIMNANNTGRYVSYNTLKGVRAAYFSGNTRQGITYKWKTISGSNPRTVSLWFYCNGYNSNREGNAILSWGRKSFKEYFCIETNKSQSLVCPWGEPRPLLAKKIMNYSWNHLVITYDGNTRTCYLNGKVTATDHVRIITDSTPLMIGTRLNDEKHSFVGGIRNVAIYNRALAPEEIKILKNCGPALEM